LKGNHLRITALWAFSEAFLGGILHGFKLPFTGLILAAFAAICMCMLAQNGYQKGRILHATILVLVVKLTLSPHTPVTAYFAVFLQGAFGEMIFSSGIPYRIAAYLIAIFGLMQSAFQKLIILTVLFGMEGWKAFDEFLNGVLSNFQVEETSYSSILVAVYLTLYLSAGIIAGHFASRLHIIPTNDTGWKKLNETPPSFNRKKKRNKPLFIVLFLLMASLVIYIYSAKNFLPWDASKPLLLFVRAFVILIFWYFFLSPVLLSLLRKWLSAKKNAFSSETEEILNLLPEIRKIVFYSWMISAKFGGLKRIKEFISNCFRLLIHPN
jgi:hypothetical protein